MDAAQRDRDKLYLSLIILGLSVVIAVFHFTCVYYIWTDHGATSAGISLLLPWFSEAYWTYNDFSWLYLGFVIIGGVLMFVRGVLRSSLEADQ